MSVWCIWRALKTADTPPKMTDPRYRYVCRYAYIYAMVDRRAACCFADMQAIKSASASNTTQLDFFSPNKLRDALRSQGNIVRSTEIPEVLAYVIKDGNFEELHDLYLVLLSNGSVQQIKWNAPRSPKYFVFTDSKSQSIFDLMTANKHQLVEHAPAWADMSR